MLDLTAISFHNELFCIAQQSRNVVILVVMKSLVGCNCSRSNRAEKGGIHSM